MSREPMRRRFRYLLPVLWGIGCGLGFQRPGDEYGLFAVGSIAGSWAALFVSGDVKNVLIPVLAAGCAVMFGLGVLLDLLRASLRLWLPIWLGAAVLVYFLSLSAHPSVEAAIAKNGSLTAYAVFSSQLGIYAATLLTLAATAVARYLAMFREDLARQG